MVTAAIISWSIFAAAGVVVGIALWVNARNKRK